MKTLKESLEEPRFAKIKNRRIEISNIRSYNMYRYEDGTYHQINVFRHHGDSLNFKFEKKDGGKEQARKVLRSIDALVGTADLNDGQGDYY